MVTIQTFKKLALSFPDVVEQPHFDKDSFRVNKKIFATLSVESNLACIKLSLIDQSVFCAYDTNIIYPVNNKWGKQGATMIDLRKIRKSMLNDALTTAYQEVLKQKGKAKKIKP
ncbi:MAG: MmcQ/YjbR family DNA-binding protein [Flavitalea sp.]